MCKMRTSPGAFFQNFDFSCCWWGKNAKNDRKWQKILSVALHISATRHHTIFIYGTDVQNDNISTCVFHFFKIMIFRVVRGVKGQKIVHNDKKKSFCRSPSVRINISWLGKYDPFLVFHDAVFPTQPENQDTKT